MKKDELYQRFNISRNKVSYTEGDVVYTLSMDLSLWYDRHCSDKGLTLSDLKHLKGMCKSKGSKYYILTNKHIYK